MTPADLDARIAWLSETVHRVLGRRGAVVQTSGGVDSAVTVALCARALGPQAVVALFLPDGATDPATSGFARQAAESAGVELVERSITAALAAQQPPAEIEAIVGRYVTGFDPGTQAFAVNQDADATRRLGTPVYEICVGPRHGEPTTRARLRADDLRRIIAAQNRKQRTRMLIAYAEAEATNRAVVGASNGDELRTGFVVKYGDDAADVCAIGDLSKAEVYEAARLLGVPRPIIERRPTTDTFGLRQSQDEYYFALPATTIARLLEDPDGTAGALDAVAAEQPGWSPAALRQLGGAVAAGLRYTTTRSVCFPGGADR